MKKFLQNNLIALIVILLGLCIAAALFINDAFTNEQGDIITSATQEKFENAKPVEPSEQLIIEPKPVEVTFVFSDSVNVVVTQEDYDWVMNEKQNMAVEIEMLAKIVYREARGMNNEQRAAVVWNVLNRLDNPRFDNSIIAVITSPNQYAWYDDTPVRDDLYAMADDVVTRWLLEKRGYSNVGRVLPSEYLYFFGSDGLNYYTTTWRGDTFWDWSWETPYN